MQALLTISKALSDETRLRAIMAVKDGELCLCQLVELLGLAPSTVSKHMNILCDADLLERRKDGRWVFFRLPGKGATPEVRKALRWVSDGLLDEQRVRSDRDALDVICQKDLEELCGCYD